VREPGQRIEMSQWKGRVVVGTDKPPAAARREQAAGDGRAPERRSAFFPELGEVQIPVYLGEQLAPGTSAAGPALVIEPETTIVVYPGWTAHVTELGNYRLEVL
jgi:N-methylhydantoinase A